MDGTIRTEILGQICDIHFPKEDLKCFQLLPSNSNGQVVHDMIKKIRPIQPGLVGEKCLIGIQTILNMDHSEIENWKLIKSLFRTNSASCMWKQDMPKFDANTEYNLQEHIDSYRVKLKYELLINLRDKLEKYQQLVNEVAWHKMIYWFNTGNTGTLDSYLNECLSELTEMKREKVVEGLNLYDFVIKDKKEAERVALHRHDSHKQLLTKYRNYRDIIGCALEMAYKRSELIKDIEKQRVYTRTVNDQEVALDYGSVRYLTNYLNNSDIRNLINVFISKIQ